MTRFSILAALALALCGQAHAAGLSEGQFTRTTEVLSSTRTCDAVAISSQTPTEVIRSSSTFYAELFVLNVSTAGALMCSDNVAVSTLTTTSNLAGIWLAKASLTAPGGSFDLTLPPGQLWYCLNDSANQSTRAVVCRSK